MGLHEVACSRRFFAGELVRGVWHAVIAADAGVPLLPHPNLFSLNARAFSSEVEPGSRKENASKQEARAPFRFNQDGKGSSHAVTSASASVTSLSHCKRGAPDTIRICDLLPSEGNASGPVDWPLASLSLVGQNTITCRRRLCGVYFVFRLLSFILDVRRIPK